MISIELSRAGKKEGCFAETSGEMVEVQRRSGGSIGGGERGKWRRWRGGEAISDVDRIGIPFLVIGWVGGNDDKLGWVYGGGRVYTPRSRDGVDGPTEVRMKGRLNKGRRESRRVGAPHPSADVSLVRWAERDANSKTSLRYSSLILKRLSARDRCTAVALLLTQEASRRGRQAVGRLMKGVEERQGRWAGHKLKLGRGGMKARVGNGRRRSKVKEWR